MVSVSALAEEADPMSREENKAIVRRANEEVWNKHNPDAVDEYYSAESGSESPLSRETPSLSDIKERITSVLAAFPDLSFTIEDLIGEGDKVAARWTSRGTHRGEFMGAPPTGNEVTNTGITISRIVDGKIREEWSEWDSRFLSQ